MNKKKYIVTVYAICKNEEKFVNRWYNSMKEADNIVVLDTGSTDNTVKLLKEKNVFVKTQVINPWRFDNARNESIKLIPKNTDICVCTDLDEKFEKGWRKKLESVWNKDTTRCRYTYNWSIDKNNIPIVSFLYEKIHSLTGFKWIHPVHEILKCDHDEKYVINDSIVLNHYPDNTKSRSSYLSLLELSVKEDSKNDRNLHYLGREYMYYGKWNKCIDTLIKHIYLPSSTWKDEKSASMRFISRCYINMNRYDEARMWLEKAINETPYLRDPYVEMALLEYKFKNWSKIKDNCLNALKIYKHEKTYINEPFSWNHTIYDLLSIAEYNLGNYTKALECVNEAIKKSDDKRLINNKNIIMQKIKVLK